MKKFEIGKKYSMTSICDRGCKWTYEVVKRTEKTITLSEVGTDELKRCKVSEYDGKEICKPLGRYSMSPTLKAE